MVRSGMGEEMKTVAQYDWTTRAEPKTGEIAGRPGKWDRQAELLLSDVDRNGEPTPIGDIHVGQLMTVTSPVGAADLTVTAVTGLRISVGVVNGYLYPINGQVVSVKWDDPPLSDNFDPTPLWGAINTEIGERQEADADLQDQIDNHQHNTDHSHPDYSLTSHDHDTAYAPTVHDHPKYAPTVHDHPHDHDADYAGKVHDHDGVYEPVHDHPYATEDALAQEIQDRKDGDDALDKKITEEIKRSSEKDSEHDQGIKALNEAVSELQSELPVREYTYTESRSPNKGELAALDGMAQPVTAWENTEIVSVALEDVNGVHLDLGLHFAGEILRISDRGDIHPDEPDGRQARIESSYLVAEITEVNVSGSLNVTPLYYGGQPDVGDDLLVEILPPAGGVDTGELDGRYVKSTGGSEIKGSRWSLTKKNNSGTSFIMQQFDGVNHMLYQLPEPTVSGQAANKSYVDTKLNEHGHQGIPWNSKSGIPAWNRKVWAASSPGSSAFRPETATGSGSTTSGSGNLVKDTVAIKFYYPEVHRYDFSGNGCLVFSKYNDSMDSIIAVFQILWISSSSSNYYTNVRCCYIWGNYTDTMRWKFGVQDGANFTSTECRWGYFMVTGGGYWGPR